MSSRKFPGSVKIVKKILHLSRCSQFLGEGEISYIESRDRKYIFSRMKARTKKKYFSKSSSALKLIHFDVTTFHSYNHSHVGRGHP